MRQLVLVAALLLAGASCGSISSTAGDAGGSGGAGGAGGQGGAPSCAQIQAGYQAALVAARECTVGATNQCQQMAGSELGCNGCPTFVNDTSGLASFATEWNQAQCDKMQACTNLACLSPKPASCKVSDGGGATCVAGLVATPAG
ncbi:MAG TPA: hypothetical protein VH853_25055 [Polyangia bacterium]|jgi:hypothetical protein|nr:hypothetical protein [Polyangia bacterium]